MKSLMKIQAPGLSLVQLQPGIWGVKQQIGDLALSPSLCPYDLKKVKKEKEQKDKGMTRCILFELGHLSSPVSVRWLLALRSSAQ